MIVVPVPLWRRGEVIAQTWISPEDAVRVVGFRWFLHVTAGGYAATTINYKHVLLHRMIMECEPGDGLLIDHEDRNRLHNWRENLRATDKSGNGQNQSFEYMKDGVRRYKGVYPHSQAPGRWWGKAILNGKVVYIGIYPSEEQAVEAVRNWRAENYPMSQEASA